MKTNPKIISVNFEGEFSIEDSETQSFRWNVADISGILSKTSNIEKNNFRISPSGYGIQWPALDEDLSFKGLPGQE